MNTFFRRLFKATSNRGGLCFVILGQTGNEFIYLVRSIRQKRNLPNLLIAGGFHGDEPAGPYAILRFIETAPDFYFKSANLSFVPCANPMGFRKGTTHARVGERTNAGYCHPEIGDVLSVEGNILMKNLPLILTSTSDGFLSLHEDIDVDKFYVYSLGDGKGPTDFALHIRDLEAMYFDPLPDGTMVSGQDDHDAVVMDGMVCNIHDGTFEDLLWHRGVKNSIVTETPAKGIPLESRVDASIAIIEEFIELSVQ